MTSARAILPRAESGSNFLEPDFAGVRAPSVLV